MREEQKFDCSQLEQALRDETPELMAALTLHAKECAACREELHMWQEISTAAKSMHKEWPAPGLWPAIARDLRTEAARPRGVWEWFGQRLYVPNLRWQAGVAALALVLISGAGAWLYQHRTKPMPPDNEHLLTDQAVQQVEQAEQTYEKSIEKLAQLAQPKLAAASTPLMINYREKLDLLDAAIGDCRSNLDKNRANAYMRSELLSFYQEKQKTLEQILKEN
ncbi:MAG: anti-sigma factor [Candidatus Acidiferrales bacterium]